MATCIMASSTSLVFSGRAIQAVTTGALSAGDFQAKVIFDEIENQLKLNGAEYVKKVNGIFCFKVKKGKDEGVWVVDLKKGTGAVTFDPSGKGDVTISMEDDNLVKLMTGELNPQQAFFQGKVKIAGNMSLAMKLRELQVKSGQSKL